MGIPAQPFARVTATPEEMAAPRSGDALVPGADVVMDRAFDLDASPEVVWPWIVQLGKGRAGWYLPRSVEWAIPPSRRAARAVLPDWQRLAVGDVIPDWGGRDATFEVVDLDPTRHLVHRSTRGHTEISWAIVMSPRDGALNGARCRVHLRLRLGPVRRVRLATHVGGAFDALTIAGLAAGLRERLATR
jgi:hypothetical protein